MASSVGGLVVAQLLQELGPARYTTGPSGREVRCMLVWRNIAWRLKIWCRPDDLVGVAGLEF